MRSIDLANAIASTQHLSGWGEVLEQKAVDQREEDAGELKGRAVGPQLPQFLTLGEDIEELAVDRFPC